MGEWLLLYVDFRGAAQNIAKCKILSACLFSSLSVATSLSKFLDFVTKLWLNYLGPGICFGPKVRGG